MRGSGTAPSRNPGLLRDPGSLAWLAVVAFALQGCGVSEAEYKALESEVEALEAERKDLRIANDDLKTRVDDNHRLIRSLEQIQRKEGEARKETREIEDYARSLENANALLESQLEKWKRATRDYLVGYEVDALTLLDGTSLTGAIILSVADEHVELTHEGETRKISYNQMSETTRLLFAHEETVLTLGRPE